MTVTIINTGGTFNKRYNPLKGELEVPTDNIALDKILSSCFNINYEVKNIISKDSLDINDRDRQVIVDCIKSSKNDNFIIIHGTDTIDLSSKFIDNQVNDKNIIFTGAMVPMSINTVEATMNFSLALGFLNADIKNGIYIAMHGAVVEYSKLLKNRKEGKFLLEK